MNTGSRFGIGGGPIGMVRDRFQWGSYGFATGLLLGVILGWIFQGVVSWIVRFGIVLLVLVPLVLAFLAWRRFSGGDDEAEVDGRGAGGDTTYVIEARSEPVVERRGRGERVVERRER